MGKRSCIEGRFGVDKRMTNMKHREFRGENRKFTMFGLQNFSQLAIAHVRILNGWRDEFLSLKYIIRVDSN